MYVKSFLVNAKKKKKKMHTVKVIENLGSRNSHN